LSPPTARPFPRFIADAAGEPRPSGRWAERLAQEFGEACAPLVATAGAPLDPETIRWFPERGWGGRVFIPATAQATEPSVPTDAPEGSEPVVVEYYGWVSYVPAEGEAEPTDFGAGADFTDVTAADSPEWQIDLSDDVIGPWKSESGRGGDVTLIWGLPLVRGAVAATAELDGEVVDQAPIQDGRFSLVAVDAVRGFGDDVYVVIKLWDRRLREVARESLYDEGGGDEEDVDPDDDE
jgi:hypothetical protein